MLLINELMFNRYIFCLPLHLQTAVDSRSVNGIENPVSFWVAVILFILYSMICEIMRDVKYSYGMCLKYTSLRCMYVVFCLQFS